jgi:outer membrane protein assembly factor BamB
VAGTHDQGAAVLFAINARAGTLKWKTKVLDLDPTSWITAEPAYSKTVDMYFIGMSSFETTLASTPGYVGFQFVGKVFAVHRCNATQAWVQYMSPPSLIPGQKPQFPGASVWGALTILNDNKKGNGHVDMEVNGGKVTVIVPTGQNYQVPDPLYQCRQNVTAECGGNNTCIVEGRVVCRGLYDSPDNLMESIVSLDGANGTRIWAYRTGDDAPWNSACVTSTTNPNCQRMDIGVDGDLSDPPMAMTIEDGQGKKIPILVGLQKSGMVHVIRQSDGSMVHANALAPQGGSSLAPGGGYGGFMWGGCNDGKYVYASHTNFASKNYTFIDGTTYNGASVIAYDPATNSKVWETKDPMNGLLPTGLPPIPTNFQSWAMMPGPTACAPGVVGATSTSGHLYGLSAKTGAILLDVQLRAGSLGSGLMFGKDAAYCSSGFRSGLYSVNKSEPFIIARLGLPEQP